MAQGLFNCDKCSALIPNKEEKEHSLIGYKQGTSIISNVRHRLLCPPCYNNSVRDSLGEKDILDWNQVNEERTPTFEKYIKYKTGSRTDNPTNKDELKEALEQDWQKHLKDQEK